MEDREEHFRHILPFYFTEKNAVQVREKLREVYERKGCVSVEADEDNK